jgi:hypothetical protein
MKIAILITIQIVAAFCIFGSGRSFERGRYEEQRRELVRLAAEAVINLRACGAALEGFSEKPLEEPTVEVEGISI